MKLQKALLVFQTNQVSSKSDTPIATINCRTIILTTLIYLICVLSIPLLQLDRIIWYGVYPILMAPLTGISYTKIFIKSLLVLPFIVFIGIFNPILDHAVAFHIGSVTVTKGWISFISIIIRGLLCMQALIILISSNSFYRVCESLSYFRVPKILIIQLLMLYRYSVVLMEEAVKMYYSVVSRGYGKSSFPLKMWSKFMGSLFINTIERSKRIHRAMKARGFDGEIHLGDAPKWKIQDLYFFAIWTLVFLSLHFINLSQIFFSTL